MIDFARDVLGTPLDPWQEWAAIHAGELLEDGRPRFRELLILAPRQNGKTVLGKAFVAYWMTIDQVPLVLGTSTDRKYAKRTWSQTVAMFQENKVLCPDKPVVRLTLGEESLIVDGSEYIFAANNGNAARSTTLHRWMCDELREHTGWECWSSASNAMNAVADAQTIVLTNQCDNGGVVLDELRAAALEFIETGAGDPRLGLIEYSAPDGCDPADPVAQAMANPNYGAPGRIDPDALMGKALRAKAAGGKQLADFRTENLCQRVTLLDPAIDPDAWTRCGTDKPVKLSDHRDKLALCFDASIDGSHATLVGAAEIDGRVHLEVIEAWSGFGCLSAVRADLPGIVERVKPRAFAWFPNGPSAAVAADLADRGHRNWPPRRVTVEAIRAEQTQVCMGFSSLVQGEDITHPKDPLLDHHIASSTRLWRGDAWVYARRGASAIDASYAAAGATHVARTLPPAPPRPVVL